MELKSYEKPLLISQANVRGVVPLAAVAALSAAQAAAIATAAGIGVGLLMGNNKGRSDLFLLGKFKVLQENISNE